MMNIINFAMSFGKGEDMSHFVVKLLSDDDGVDYDKDQQVWHYSGESTGDPCVLCSGEYFGEGQSNCKFIEKRVKRGGITCKKCLRIIKEYKAIKL